MEEHDLDLVIETINQVYDNIWLGDLETAKKIADTNLMKIQSQVNLSELKMRATKTREILRKMKKKAREKGIKERRLWVAEKLLKALKKQEFDPIKNIYGVLVIHLLSLKEAATNLIEAQAQKTMESFTEKGLEKGQVLQKGERYRYSIRSLPDRWEVHAILDRPAHAWNLGELRDQLVNYDMSIREVSKRAFSTVFEIYSRDMYIQVLGQEKLVQILIRAPVTKDAEGRVSRMVGTIVSSLVA